MSVQRRGKYSIGFSSSNQVFRMPYRRFERKRLLQPDPISARPPSTLYSTVQMEGIPNQVIEPPPPPRFPQKKDRKVTQQQRIAKEEKACRCLDVDGCVPDSPLYRTLQLVQGTFYRENHCLGIRP